MSKLLATEGLRAMLSATAAMAAVAMALYGLARFLGWEFVEARDDVMLGVVADQRSVVVVVTAGWLPVAISTAAIVVAIVLTASRTRMLISAGLTRRAIMLGTGVTLVVLLAYALVMGALITLFLGPPATAGFMGAESTEASSLLANGVSGLALGLVGSVTVTVLFLRWTWWVGVLVLVPLCITLSFTGAVGALEAVGSVGLPWMLWAVAGVLAFAYWAMMRRLPVR
ncbi:MAG: hypothetical protein WA892_07900 [Ornithinimicrobium sp.]